MVYVFNTGATLFEHDDDCTRFEGVRIYITRSRLLITQGATTELDDKVGNMLKI